MSFPLVSILCVTYNQREFVGDTIAGLQAQDYPNLQIVIADDGSTDGTPERLRDLTSGDARFTVIAGTHAGITANSNRGLAACRGRYLAVTGGDDVMLPGKISRQVEWMEADAGRVLCGHDVDVFQSVTGETLYHWSERFPLPHGRGAEAAVQSVPFCATAIMVRRSAIPASGFDARVPMASDWKLWIDCLYPDGEYGYVAGVLARYRRHDRNVTGGTGAGPTERLIAEQLLIWDLVEREHPSLARACHDARADACLEAAKAMHAHGERRRAVALLWGAVRRRPLHTLGRAVRYGLRAGPAAPQFP